MPADLQQYIPIVLPTGLFLVTLAIIFIVHRMDKKAYTNVFDKLNREKDIAQREAEKLGEKANEYADKVSAEAIKVNRLISEVDGKLKELNGYSDDISALQDVIDAFREVLFELSDATVAAEKRVSDVTEEREKLDALEGTVKRFYSDLEKVEEGFNEQEKKLSDMRASITGDMEKASEEFAAGAKEKVDALFADGLDATDTAFKAMASSEKELLTELSDRLQLTKEISKMLLDNASKALGATLAEINSKAQQITINTETNARLEERIAEAKETISGLDLEISSLESRIMQLKGEVQSEEEALIDLRAKREAEEKKAPEPTPAEVLAATLAASGMRASKPETEPEIADEEPKEDIEPDYEEAFDDDDFAVDEPDDEPFEDEFDEEPFDEPEDEEVPEYEPEPEPEDFDGDLPDDDEPIEDDYESPAEAPRPEPKTMAGASIVIEDLYETPDAPDAEDPHKGETPKDTVKVVEEGEEEVINLNE